MRSGMQTRRKLIELDAIEIDAMLRGMLMSAGRMGVQQRQ